MAHDRRERFGDLQQLFDAVSVIEPHRSPPEERGLLAALLARVKRWEERAQNAAALALLRHEHESVEARLLLQERSTARLAELGERVGLLEAALQAQRAEQAAGLARLQQNLRELVEDRRREEARERELEETRAARLLLHPLRAPLLPVIAVALVAAVAASAAVVVLFERLRAPASPAPLPVSSPAVLPADSAPSPIAAAPPAPPLSADAGGAPPALASPLPPQANPAAAAPASTGPASAVSPSTPAPPLVAAPSGATAPVPAATTPAAPAPAADAHAPPPATAAAPAPEKPLAPLRADAKSAAGRTEQRPLGRARTLLNRGDSALEKGRTETAVNSFLAALESDPTLTEAHRGLGMAYAMQGNDAAAKKEYQLYLANSPGAADADDIRAAINELNQRSKLGP
jgi:tetratricopeptide (TPR) repeat protein